MEVVETLFNKGVKIINKGAEIIGDAVAGDTKNISVETEEIMASPEIEDIGKQKGGNDDNDPNSKHWEAKYYKYKHLYLKETGR